MADSALSVLSAQLASKDRQIEMLLATNAQLLEEVRRLQSGQPGLSSGLSSAPSTPAKSAIKAVPVSTTTTTTTPTTPTTTTTPTTIKTATATAAKKSPQSAQKKRKVEVEQEQEDAQEEVVDNSNKLKDNKQQSPAATARAKNAKAKTAKAKSASAPTTPTKQKNDNENGAQNDEEDEENAASEESKTAAKKRKRKERELAEQVPEKTDPKSLPAGPLTAKGKELTKKGPGGLVYIDIEPGRGPAATLGRMLTMKYKGYLRNGTLFDSGNDFSFRLGLGEVITGWDKGILGMRAGGKRKLVIPAKMAYGKKRMGKIPPNSDLCFDVEVVRIH